MNDDLIRKIGDVVDKKINKAFGSIKKQLDNQDTDLSRINNKLDALSGDIEQLHMDVKGIRDKEGMAHSRNKREIDEIKSHIGLPITPDTPKV